MAVVLVAAGGVAALAGIIGYQITTRNRHTHIVNDTPHTLRVIIDDQDVGTICPGQARKFYVKNPTPVIIQVSCDGGSLHTEVADYNHRDFIVRITPSGGLRLLRSKLLDVLTAE